MAIDPLDLVLSPNRRGGFSAFDSTGGRFLRPVTDAALIELALGLVQHGHLGVAVYEVGDFQYEVRLNGDVLGRVQWDEHGDSSFAADYDGKYVSGFKTTGEAARRVVERTWLDSTYEVSRLQARAALGPGD
jgi:hypothetical protein